MYDAIVIGGGVIGLSIARRLAETQSVLLVDRGPTGQGASAAAAGMLTPLSEADEGPFFQLCRASFGLYSRFVEELQDETGIDVGFSVRGLLFLASSEESAAALRKRYEWHKKAGFESELISGADVLKLEPLITAHVLAGSFLPAERGVSPRKLLNALRESCYRRGVEVRTGLHVDEIRAGAVHVGHMTIEAPSIIIASGVWSADLRGLDPPIPVFPRKGQILSLGMPAGAIRHMIRWEHAYFVPRATGELVVGATNEDAGFDLSTTPAGLGRLLNEAQAISSHVGNYPILETWTGLRPATPDGFPVLGRSALPGVYYATGHYRNGILLAPMTASIIADLIQNRAPAVSIEPFAPPRFAMKHV